MSKDSMTPDEPTPPIPSYFPVQFAREMQQILAPSDKRENPTKEITMTPEEAVITKIVKSLEIPNEWRLGSVDNLLMLEHKSGKMEICSVDDGSFYVNVPGNKEAIDISKHDGSAIIKAAFHNIHAKYTGLKMRNKKKEIEKTIQAINNILKD